MRNKKLHVGIVTAFPPSNGSLNEYAFHFVQALAQKFETVGRITLFVDEEARGATVKDARVPVSIVPCWEFDALNSPRRITRAVCAAQPDVVLFNIQFASFGHSKVTAALGLTTPRLLKKAGIPTVVLLHNIMETVDLDNVGHATNWLSEKIIRTAGTMLTQVLLGSDLVALTIPKYVDILKEKYAADNVILAPHGTFNTTPQAVSFDETDGPQKILAFGKFGTYKKVEALIEAFDQLQQTRDLELVIAGSDSPNAKGYLADMAATYAHVPNITFTGYVAEEDVPRIFSESSVVVFPYTSTTGSSGVLHQAGEFGKATVLPDIGDFAEVIREEGFTGAFFEPEDMNSLADALALVLDDTETRTQMARQNYLAAQGLSISDVVDWYVLHFQELCANTLPVPRPQPTLYRNRTARPTFAPVPSLIIN